MSTIAQISNGEQGSTIRGKINASFDAHDSEAIQLLRLHDPNLVFSGFVNTGTATPAHTANKAYIATSSGTIFGVTGVVKGQVLRDNGTDFLPEYLFDIKSNLLNNKSDLSLIKPNIFSDSVVYPTGRNETVFSSKIGTDFYTEKNNWFDQDTRILDTFSVRSLTTNNFSIGIFTIDGSNATKISERLITGVKVGVNQYTLAEIITDIDLIEKGTKYYIFCANSIPTGGIGYIGSGGSNFSIFRSNESLAVSQSFIISCWVNVSRNTFIPEIAAINFNINSLLSSVFVDELYPTGRSLDTFSLPIDHTQWFNEDEHWFDQDSRIIDTLSVYALVVGDFKIGIFTIDGTVSTFIAEATFTADSTGINTFDFLEYFSSDLFTKGVKYYLFTENTSASPLYRVVGYIGSGSSGRFINNSDLTTFVTHNYKIGFWINVKKPLVLSNSDYNYLMGDAVDGFDLASEIANKELVFVPPGIHTISSTINIPAGRKIRGVRGKSIIQADASLTTVFNIDEADDVTLKDLTIKGVAANTVLGGAHNAPLAGVVDTFADAVAETNVGTKKGIYINDSERVNIEGCEISNFDAYGIHNELSGKVFEYGVKFSDNYFHDNYCNYKCNSEAEYSTFVGNSFTLAQIGVRCESGNNIWSTNHVDKNRVGLVMTDGYNNSHGSWVGCTFNHNSLYGIALSLLSAGEVFSGCQHWYGDIYVKDSKGVIFNGCQIGDTTIFADGNFATGGMWIITNCIWMTSSAVQHNYLGNTSDLRLKNNHKADGSDSAYYNN